MGTPIRPQPSTAMRRLGVGEGVKGVSVIVVVGMALKNQRQKMLGRNHEDFFSHRLANRLQAQCIKVTTV
jgi:hypothetical protein